MASQEINFLAGLNYGLLECPKPGYPAGRRKNVADADTMLLLGDRKSRGSIGLMKDWDRIAMCGAWCWVDPGVSTPRSVAGFLRSARRGGRGGRTVLVAGNRESVMPGIGDRAERFLIRVFRLLTEG